MFFPFTNYKRIRADASGGTPALYTATAVSLVVFQPDSSGHDGGLFYDASPDQYFSWPEIDGTTKQLQGSIIIPSGGVIRGDGSGSGDVNGYLHIFELP